MTKSPSYSEKAKIAEQEAKLAKTVYEKELEEAKALEAEDKASENEAEAKLQMD